MTTPTAWPQKLRWLAAAVLCGTVLVALWLTAWRVRAQKLAAREASRDSAPIEAAGGIDPGPLRLTLVRGQKLRVGHFILSSGDPLENLSIHDARGAHLVEFLRFKPGEIRRWQEFQLTLLEAGRESVTLEYGFRPGEPCFGAGRFVALREGLRIELPGGKSVTVLRSDADREELRLDVQAALKSKQVTLAGPRAEDRVHAILLRLERSAAGLPSLRIEEE